MPVPSPTYLLHNSYEAYFPTTEADLGGESSMGSLMLLHHLDLYRLQGKQDMARLDMQRLASTGAPSVSTTRRGWSAPERPGSCTLQFASPQPHKFVVWGLRDPEHVRVQVFV